MPLPTYSRLLTRIWWLNWIVGTEPALCSVEDGMNSQLQLQDYLTACTLIFLWFLIFMAVDVRLPGFTLAYLAFNVFLLCVCVCVICDAACGSSWAPSYSKVNKVPEKYSLLASGMCHLGRLHLKFACDIFLLRPGVHVCVVSVTFFFFFLQSVLWHFCQSVASEMNAPGCLCAGKGELRGVAQFPIWNFSLIGLGFVGKF